MSRPFEQPPEVIHVPAAERNDRHEAGVDGHAEALGDAGQHDLLAVALAQDDEPGEIQLGICPHGLADELVRLAAVGRQLDRLDDRVVVRLRFEPQVADPFRLDAAA